MNDWKELKIEKIPEDILLGNYEWEVVNGGFWETTENTIVNILIEAINNIRYRYRKPESKQLEKKCMAEYTCAWITHCKNCKWFIGKESADIPPE